VAGEIYIGGAAVTRGYIKRDELTAEKYVSIDGERYYRTGDLGRFLADGQIEFLGREDEQVKIRGYRVELGEVEAVLRGHEAVGEALVLAREEGAGGDKRLVAYVVARADGGEEAAPLGAQELRAYLRERVPDHMVPSAFVMLEELPLTSNGKVDRRALPDPAQSISAPERTFVIPRNTLEMQLAQIWEEVLSVSPVGATDNFFELGGHSLLAVRLMAKIQQQFNRKLPLASLFQKATVEDQAALLAEGGDSLPWSPLVALQPNGTRRPFFCVHPAGGQVLCYYQLARALGPGQPFYAWQAPDFTEVAEGGEDNYGRIEDRAAAYIEAMRRVQPEGPYMLGGWSFGGTVAFEIAQQLRRAGERVGLLAQLDAIAPVARLKLDQTLMLLGLAREMTARAGKVFRLTAEDIRGLDEEGQLAYVLEHLKAAGVVAPDVDPELAFRWTRSNLRGFQLRHQSFENYAPEIYPGQITLLRAELNPAHQYDEATRHIAELYEDPTHGWARLTSQPVKVVPVSGYHETMILEPHVRVLAGALAACMQDAEVID
jgi:thioesterase domain-containing protein/acyl carrier protein